MPILGSNSSGGSRPSAPVIGSATDGGTGTTASVAFTPSTYIGKGTITYTATSNPGGLTATGSSPITVTGLTTGTAYTFTVQGTTNYGITSEVSSASNSVTPASPSSYESIAKFTPTSGTSVTFSSISGAYKSLQLRITSKDSYTTSATGDYVAVTFNSDTGANYTQHYLRGNGTNVVASGAGASNYVYIKGASMTSGTGLTNITGAAIIDIIDYASTTKNKTVKALAGGSANLASNNYEVVLSSGLWMSTTAITSVTVACGSTAFATGTSIALYGVK